MTDEIVKVCCLEHIYPDKTRVEICGIDFVVNKGERVAVLGPSGGGKTTIIKHILGILKPNKGSVSLFGIDPTVDFAKVGQRVGVVLQNVEEQLIGPTVLDDIIFTPMNYGYSRSEAVKLAESIMQNLDILHLQDKIIHYLSGGEKRKVALAGALVLKPELLVLDEPFSGLDIKSQKELINLINTISNEQKISVIVSTHDVELVCEFANTMYLVSKNQMSKKGTPDDIFKDIDSLKSFNLEPPQIIKFIKALNDKGYNVDYTVCVQEAVNSIESLFSR